jgi:predicted nucleotidyltransferase component of viral defense system
LRLAARSGARDIGNVEIDVILTHLLQLLMDKGVMNHLAFKGSTMLRKMVFGPRGRLSTDLDLTCRTDTAVDDLIMVILEALSASYHGLSFRFDRDRDWYLSLVRNKETAPFKGREAVETAYFVSHWA